MPIYAYRCAECGHTKDALQKMSDAPLTTCPACGQEAFHKQVTAAGFALKGSGWYVTDFKGTSAEKNSNTSVATDTSNSKCTSTENNATSNASTISTSTNTSNTTGSSS